MKIIDENNNRATLSVAKLERIVNHQSLEAQGYQAPNSPVDILVHSVRQRRSDVEGTSFKYTLDGIVQAGVIPDDGPNQVRSVKYTQEKGNEEKTIITLEE